MILIEPLGRMRLCSLFLVFYLPVVDPCVCLRMREMGEWNSKPLKCAESLRQVVAVSTYHLPCNELSAARVGAGEFLSVKCLQVNFK